MSTLNELVKSYQTCEFVLLNRGVMKEIGINPTIVLSELLSRFNYHASKKELDKDGSFFLTTEKMEELTTLKYKAQAKAIDTLEGLGLIKVFHKDGNKRYFQILVDGVKTLIEKFSKKVYKEEKQNQPEGNSSSAQKRKLVLPKGKISLYKKQFSKTPINKNQNKDNKPNNSSSSKKTEKIEKMSEIHQVELEYFLQSKGFNTYMVNKTVEEFNKKGITMFTIPSLQDAYEKMVQHNEKVEKVMYPPVFFANGVAMSLPKIPKVELKIATPSVDMPIYNWLE